MKKILIAATLVLGLAQAAAAIPAFARKYSYSCEVCHAPVPHLKAFGEDFMENGYRIPDKEPPRATIDTGDPLLLLQRDLPLAFRFDAYLSYEPKAEIKSDFRAPIAMKILSGGQISDSVSYYTYFLLAEDGKIAGLEDTYLNFRGIFGLPVDIVFGQYRITDPIKATETRLTFENYAIFKFRVGDSRINLAYDRGLMAAAGTDFGLDFVAQIVNGNGIEEQEIFDSDKYKSFVWRVAQNLWENNLRLGVFGYTGREAGEGGRTNDVNYFGPDARLRIPGFELLLGYQHRSDSNPFFLAQPTKVASRAYLAEAILSPWGEKGRWFFVAAWNRVDSDIAAASRQTLTLNANTVLRRNLKWVFEYTHDFEFGFHRWTTGVMSAF
jgi:hypothetical protein